MDLFSDGAGVRRADSRIMYAVALEDSADGMVLVRFDAGDGDVGFSEEVPEENEVHESSAADYLAEGAPDLAETVDLADGEVVVDEYEGADDSDEQI